MSGNRAGEGEVQVEGGLPDSEWLRSRSGWFLDLPRPGRTGDREWAVVDSASIEVNRRQRRTKTDQVDLNALLRLLQRYAGGERERLVKERGSHSARIQSLLVAHGIRLPIDSDLVERLETMTGADWGMRWERTGKSGDWTGG
ncbi:MAG: hypothetical protein ACRESZ_11025 [Methylococcales bacterium]